MNTPHLWLAMCMLILASTANTLRSQTDGATIAPVLVQLDYPLSQNTLAQLRAEGVELLHHYGNGAYLVSNALQGFSELHATQLHHVDQATALHAVESGAKPKGQTRIEVDLVLAFGNASDFLTSVLAKADFHTSTSQIEDGRTLSGTVPASALEELLAHPYILDATPSLTEAVPYNFEARVAQSLTPLNSGIPGAPELNGTGIIIGVGDGGALGGHPDLGERILHSTEQYNAGWGSHPDMVSGIIAGAGNVFSSNRGVASEAELIVESNSAIVYHAPTYLQEYGMTITNNSYGPSFHCNTANQYFGNSASTDQQLYDNPSLLHVYAVGNSGTNTCTDIPQGYSTIPGGPQNAKNTLSVGNVDFTRTRYQTSSAGPTSDGRLKPEISAIGTAVTTTVRNGGYGTGTGTSYAAPNVASSLALLSEAFQRNNQGEVPQGALLKAIACNTADDAGRSGPDFEYGFGIMNAYHALQVIEAGQYSSGTIRTGEQSQTTITIDRETTELKVMLYWNDIAGSTSNQGPVLEDDFELLLVSMNSGEQHYPLVLNPSNPTAVASPGEDHLNNIEQVTVQAPAPGAYQVIVRASHLTYGEGNFFLTWYAPAPEVVLTSPFGGESIIPGQSTPIAWTATTADQGEWKIEYASEGNNWQVIADGISGEKRSISWSAPSSITQAEFRITNTESGIADETNAVVSILSPPQNLISTELCETSSLFSWKPTAGAVRYAVYQFDGEQMNELGTTTDTSWVFGDLAHEEELLISVAAIAESNAISKRAYALKVIHSGNEPECDFPSIIEWGDTSTEELGDAVRVSWEVSREQETSRFELERGLMSANQLEWSLVDSVKARGTSNSTINYRLDDHEAATEGFTFYRVRMIDNGGVDSYSEEFTHERSSSTSPTEDITPATSSNETETFALLQNPVGDVISIRSKTNATQQLELYDLIGRKQSVFNLNPGENQLAWPSGLGTGMYLLKTTDQSSSEAIKIIHR